MSVIGRMDKQVEDVLISPLARNNNQNQEAETNDETTSPLARRQSERETAPAQKRRAEQDELPVWLL